MARYQVILNTGETINVPNDSARTKYEYISVYGLQAVLERASRTRAYRRAKSEQDATFAVIVCPNGEEITQF